MTTAPGIDFTALAEAGQKIAALRNDRSWTGGELAERAGISRSHLSYIENGRRPAHPDVYRKIAKALKVSARSITPAAS